MDKLKAKLIFADNTAFFTSMLYGLEFEEDYSADAAYTTGHMIGFNPDFMSVLSDDSQQFVLVHEICHVAFNHIPRAKGKDADKWNRACDYWINHYLVSVGFRMPPAPYTGLYDERFTHDMSVNEIYNLLPDEPEKENPMAGDIKPDPNDDPKELEDKTMEAVLRATLQAEKSKQAGTLPGGLQRMLHDYLNPQIPWSVVLANFLYEKSTDDYSWSRPNRRYEDIYIPSIISEGMGRIAIYIDCSCSVSQEEFAAQMTEAQALKDMFNPFTMDIIFFNQGIVSVTSFARDEQLDIELPVSGGTRIGPVMNHLDKHPADVAVIMTDGYFSHVPLEPSTPIFWVIVDNTDFEYPFGTVLNIKVNYVEPY